MEEPWYLTIVRTQGVLFLRPEKSWRPVVSVSLVDSEQTIPETVLGCDGQNPNMKMPLALHDVAEHSKLDIKILHYSRTKKKGRRRHLVGSAYVTLGDLLRRQERPGSDITLTLKCPPPQKRSPSIGGTRQAHTATLTVRLMQPCPPLQSASSQATLVASEYSSEHEGDSHSDANLSDGMHYESPAPYPEEGEPDNILADESAPGLRKRHKRLKHKPYFLDSADEAAWSSGSESPYPLTPPPEKEEDYFNSSYDADAEITFDVAPCAEEEICQPSILPQYARQPTDGEYQLSLMEKLVDIVAPYGEMTSRDCDFDRVLGRLLTEWYAVGGSLLATATLNAAVFGYSAGTLFDVDGLALRSVTVGSIVSAIGLLWDVWLLLVYSGADSAKFQRLALDVYQTYFFFCLTCRVPTFCLFVAICALTIFLLAVAWSAWSTAVLVMCCAAGMLLTLQYLVYGCHRVVNWCIWVAWRVTRGVRSVLFRPVYGSKEATSATESVPASGGAPSASA